MVYKFAVQLVFDNGSGQASLVKIIKVWVLQNAFGVDSIGWHVDEHFL